MEIQFRTKRIWVFTLALGLLMLSTSIGGLLDGHMYSRETPASLAQCIGQDIVNLVVILPTLLASGFLLWRGRRRALFVWLGATLYIIYTYVIYCFAVRFNTLFLVYCAVLGLSVYAIITTVVTMDLSAVKAWYDEKRSVSTPATFLFALALMFSLLWLKDIVPALIHGEVPQDVKEAGLLTNPVHVLDLSVALPGFVITSILLLKKDPYGYLFAPAFLIFAALMNVTIGALVVVMKYKGLAGDYALTGVFALLALVTIFMFLRLVKFGGDARSSAGAAR
jgi:hypothetical protein